jgi:peptidyl-prolyl cis-trans isomerase B (cyclophilin B)
MYFKCALIAMLLVMLCSCEHGYVRPENYKNPQAEIQTELGTITIELYEDKVPNTVSNFILLAESGFYDDMLVHGIIKGLKMQAGCPNTKVGGDFKKIGVGGPGYKIAEEFHPELRHDKRGVIGMAKHIKNTSGSQFYITFDKIPLLDENHSVFGRVIKGADVLERIEGLGNAKGVPNREILIKVKILEKNDIKYFVNKIEE